MKVSGTAWQQGVPKKLLVEILKSPVKSAESAESCVQESRMKIELALAPPEVELSAAIAVVAAAAVAGRI